MLRVIREVRPEYVVGENVFGLISWNGGMVFDEVQTDLENEGYEVWAFVLPACSVNAPHRRDRVWFVAHRSNAGAESVRFGRENAVYGSIATANANVKRNTPQGEGGEFKANWCGNDGKQKEWAKQAERTNGFSGPQFDAANANCNERRERRMHKKESVEAERYFGAQHTRDFGNSWDNFPTQSPVCGRNDGISAGLVGITVSSHRRNSIKAYGNAIVPQVAYQIFKAIQQSEPC